MEIALAASAVTYFLATIMLSGVRERFSGSKWEDRIVSLQVLCLVLWLVSVVALTVFFPGNSTPDPRF